MPLFACSQLEESRRHLSAEDRVKTQEGIGAKAEKLPR